MATRAELAVVLATLRKILARHAGSFTVLTEAGFDEFRKLTFD
jgi:hypothetical protein